MDLHYQFIHTVWVDIVAAVNVVGVWDTNDLHIVFEGLAE